MPNQAPAIYATERLLVRELDTADLVEVFPIVSSTLNTAYLPAGAVDLEHAEAFILRAQADRLKERRRYALAVCLKQTGKLIGLVTLTLDEELPVGRIGYVIGMEHWRQGFGSEAVNGLVRFAFLGLELHRLFAETDEKNLPSARVLEKCGFRREGHLIKARRAVRNGRTVWTSVFHYAMLKKEYLSVLPDGFHSPTEID